MGIETSPSFAFTSQVMQPNKAFRIVASAASTNAMLISSVSGGVGSITGYNAASAPRFLKLYNQASVPNVGTDIPFLTMFLPAQDVFPPNIVGGPLLFSAGIGIAITAQSSDDDNTPVGAGEIMGLNLPYY